MRQHILTILEARCGVEQLEPLKKALDSQDIQKLSVAWSAAYRWVGKDLLNPSDTELKALAEVSADIDWSLWTLDELARALILVTGCEKGRELFDHVSRYFDHRESMACCRALSLLKDPARFEQYGTESCRTNSAEIFKSMAWGNPYARDHFNDVSFNQMVIKSMFLGLELSPIVGLKERITDETRRMAQDYCDELKAAGRPMPIEIEWVLTEFKKEA